MGIVVALVAFAVWRMDRHINCHAVATDLLLGADLGGQGQLPFAGRYGVAAGGVRATLTNKHWT